MGAAPRRVGLRLEAEPVQFSFDGRQYTGQRGDSAASALLAHGVRLLGRSVKYRRPRGLLALGPEEPNALFTVGTAPAVIPNVSAPQLPISDGLVLRSQNRWPSLRYDLASLLQAGGGFFGAGFYYKTFIWPSWRRYEGLIRRLAGLGEAPGAAALPAPSIEHLSCDVLVGGAGPAGLAAALAAARTGARVVICEREPELGGELEFEGGTIDGHVAAEWIGAVETELARHGARVLTSTAIVGGSDGLIVAYGEPGDPTGRQAVYRIRPHRFIVTMGAIERPIAFENNDRPGVMLVGAAERLLARYGVPAGARPLVFGNHDRLYAAAQRLTAAGVQVRALIDTRDRERVGARAAPAAALVALERAGVECLFDHAVLSALGRISVRGARIGSLATRGDSRRIDCDAILVSGGWSPAVHAGMHEGGARELAADGAAFVAGRQPDWRGAAGAAAGAMDLASAITDGYTAGTRAARALGAAASIAAAPTATGDGAPNLLPFWRSPASLAEKSASSSICRMM